MRNNLKTYLLRIIRLRHIDIAAIGVALVTYGAITLHNMGLWSIWFDEAFSAYLTRFNFIDIARYTATDVHPPLYYWVLKIWVSIFGSSTEVDLRSLSMVFGMVVIVIGFLLVRKLFGRKAGYIALLFLALSPMLVRYGQEARMYTMAAAIVLSATYVLVLATETNKRKYWVIYGILVAIGMWTHYLIAVAWIAHLVWRYWIIRAEGKRGKKLRQAFLTKNVKLAYIIAIVSFLPWLPFMAIQLTSIQVGGFWIGAVGAYSFTSYLTNVLFYLEHSQAVSWIGFAFYVIVISLLILTIKTYKGLKKADRRNYQLILCVAFVPVILLFLVSLPPLHSSFVERYLMSSVAGFSLFAAITITVGMKRVRQIWQSLLVVFIAGSMIYGITNVYHYGNYNKNSNQAIKTKYLVQDIATKATSGEPIIANSPWVFYEAIFYDSTQHPIYFIDAKTDYKYGSLDMLKYSDAHKIKDLAAFVKEHPTVWVVDNAGSGPIVSPVASWKPLQTFSIHDPIANADNYKATEYQTN